jgi:hypothetical protein
MLAALKYQAAWDTQNITAAAPLRLALPFHGQELGRTFEPAGRVDLSVDHTPGETPPVAAWVGS